MDNEQITKYEALRPADLVAKIAQVNLRGVIRALAAARLVAQHLGVDAGDLLKGHDVEYPDAKAAQACDEAFEDLRASFRKRDIFKIRDIR